MTPTTDHAHTICLDRHPALVFEFPHCGECGERTDWPQVWCDKCDQPVTRAIELADGTIAFRCNQHAWLLIAPKGAHV